MPILSSIIRYMILGAVSWLTAKGVLTDGLVTEAHIALWTNIGIFIVTTVGMMAWSWLEKKALGVLKGQVFDPKQFVKTIDTKDSAYIPASNEIPPPPPVSRSESGKVSIALVLLLATWSAVLLLFTVGCAHREQGTASVEPGVPAVGKPTEKVPAYSEIIDGLKSGTSKAVGLYKTSTGQIVVHTGLIALGKFLISTLVAPEDQQSIKNDLSGFGGLLLKLDTNKPIEKSDVTQLFLEHYPTTGGERADKYNGIIGTVSGLIEGVLPGINALGSPVWVYQFLLMTADAAWQVGGMTGSTWKPYVPATPVSVFHIIPVPEMSFWLRTPKSPPSVFFDGYVQHTREGAMGALLV